MLQQFCPSVRLSPACLFVCLSVTLSKLLSWLSWSLWRRVATAPARYNGIQVFQDADILYVILHHTVVSASRYTTDVVSQVRECVCVPSHAVDATPNDLPLISQMKTIIHTQLSHRLSLATRYRASRGFSATSELLVTRAPCLSNLFPTAKRLLCLQWSCTTMTHFASASLAQYRPLSPYCLFL